MSRPATAAVVGYARTPFGKFGGSLRPMSLPDLGAHVVRAALSRAGLDGSDVDELVFGVNFPGSDRSIARQISLRAGLPADRISYTVDQACCSALTATTMAARSIALGEARCAISGGAENLSRVPYFLETTRWGNRLGPITLTDQLVVSCPHTGVPRAIQAADEAAAFGIDRVAQDEWAVRSQERFAAAVAKGHFDHEIAPLDTAADGERVALAVDEVPRQGVTLAALAALPTVNGSATVTAGNAPNLSTGAGALVLMADDEVTARGATRRATLSGWSLVCGEPAAIASIPATAIRAALARAELTLDDVDLIEINEAFAAVPLVSTLVLAGGDRSGAAKLREITNVNGGAIAVGHPTSATGARLVMTAIGELERRGGGTAVVGICGGVGEAAGIVVRV
jgi:acetyl-CoA C-acetyltransferase